MHRVQITWYLFFAGLTIIILMFGLTAFAPSYLSEIKSYFSTVLYWTLGVMFVFEFRNWRKSWEDVQNKKGP